jgi:dephospho-CoA kinase
MRRVALTGGIATGKSTALRRFQHHHVPTIDADIVARDVVAPGTPAAARIRDRFGDRVFDPEGAVDRKALAALIFSDESSRAALERIVHPDVYAAIALWFATLPPATPLAVADIPLLFETGHSGDFDVVIVVACEPDQQVARVIQRDGLTEAEARRRVAAQWPIAEKVQRADYVIRTDGSRADTDRQVDALIEVLR